VAEQGYNLLLGQYASPEDVGHSIAVFRDAVETSGRRFDPMQVGVTRAFCVTDSEAEKEAALERRLQNRVRQLKLATRPDGTVHGGPDRATGDPRTVNVNSAMYGTPEEIAQRLGELRDAGAGRLCPDQWRRFGRRGSRSREPAPLCGRGDARIRPRAQSIRTSGQINDFLLSLPRHPRSLHRWTITPKA